MKLHRAAPVVALALATVSAPAFAQDRETHFDGPYVSGTIGMGVRANGTSDRIVFDTNRDGTYGDAVNTALGTNAFAPGFCNGTANTANAADGCRRDDDDIEYSGRIGYDKRIGNWVVGALFEVSRNESVEGTSAFSTTPASYAFTRELDHALSLRARAGYTPNGGALFYVTGGGSYAKIKHGFATTNTANSFAEVNDGDRVWGWQAGGGAEIMLTNNISLGLEYLYNRYKDDKYHVVAGPGTAPPTNPFLLVNANGTGMRPSDTRYDFHSLRASLSFQF